MSSNGLDRDSENLSVLKSTLDTDRVVALATQIHRSRRILVVGVDLAASLAWFLAYGLMPLGLECRSAGRQRRQPAAQDRSA